MWLKSDKKYFPMLIYIFFSFYFLFSLINFSYFIYLFFNVKIKIDLKRFFLYS